MIKIPVNCCHCGKLNQLDQLEDFVCELCNQEVDITKKIRNFKNVNNKRKNEKGETRKNNRK